MNTRKVLSRFPVIRFDCYRKLLVGPAGRGVAFPAALLLLCLIPFDGARAQSLKARIEVLSLSPARLKIEGRRVAGGRAWSFQNSYAGANGLAERIENLRLMDDRGASLAARRLAPGEYQAAGEATQFSYEMKLEPPANPTDASHVSWLAGKYGLFALGDLLPLVNQAVGSQSAPATSQPASAIVSFSLPAGWHIASNETQDADGQFALTDAESAVFFAGESLRERRERVGRMELDFVTTGEWAFADEDAASLAGGLLKDYAGVFGGVPRERVMLMLSPFPSQVHATDWSAETRGATVTLLSGRSPSKNVGIAQLSVPLAHELFHLWVPNGLALDGNYDWFYEGFTNYQAMLEGMRLNFLTFQDYLNALGRSYDAYLSIADRDRLSLPEASARRWVTAAPLVYHKGLLVAFLYDLHLRMQTGGKRSLEDVYRELFRSHHAASKRTDGNAAVIAALSAPERMRDFVHLYIEGAGAIDLEQALMPFGLRVERLALRSHLSVSGPLTRSQRDLLRKFGYNDEPRGSRHD